MTDNQFATDFRDECDTWLNPKGYTLHSISNKGLHLTYTNFNRPNSPSIVCYVLPDGAIRVGLTNPMQYKYFMRLKCGPIQFKHKDIDQYINISEHYSNLAEKFPPF